MAWTSRTGGGAPMDPAQAASAWVQRWCRRLPAGARVLDLACGHGRHVRWLAAQGHRVTALDRDAAALDGLRGTAAEVIAFDLEPAPGAGAWPDELAAARFDAVVVTNYLWRPLWPRLCEAVDARGLLIVETFAVEQAALGRPRNPDHLLRPGELVQALAPHLHVLAYEHGCLDAGTPAERWVQRACAVRPPPREAPVAGLLDLPA